MLLERYWIFNVVPMNQYIYKIKKKVSVDFFLSFLNLFLSAFFFFLIFGCSTFFRLNFTFNFQRCHRHKDLKPSFP